MIFFQIDSLIEEALNIYVLLMKGKYNVKTYF